jgi:hypothetical protein
VATTSNLGQSGQWERASSCGMDGGLRATFSQPIGLMQLTA